MRWPWVSRGRLLEAYANLQRSQDRIDDLEHLVDIAREKARRQELDARDLAERNRRLEGELDSTDPYTISRRAAENGNARAAELMDALQRAKLLRERGMEVPEDVLDIIRRGSREWSR